MKISIILCVFAIIFASDYAYGNPTGSSEKTSTIEINNGITIDGLPFKEDHPLISFGNSEKNAKCSGYCVCQGTKCKCSCSGCSLGQCVGGCLAAC